MINNNMLFLFLACTMTSHFLSLLDSGACLPSYLCGERVFKGLETLLQTISKRHKYYKGAVIKFDRYRGGSKLAGV